MHIEVAPRRPAVSSGVSVIVPCYNYGHFVGDCLSSILRDNGDVDVEVILLDDASTDDSAAVCRSWAAADPRIRFIEHRTNRGHIATYNQGLDAVTKEFVTLVSADDMLTKGALRRALAVFERHPSVGMVYGPIRDFSSGYPAPLSLPITGHSIWSGHEWIEGVYRRALNPICSPEAVVRTSVHRRAGYYNPAHPHAGDLDMWLRVAGLSDVGRVNGAAQALRRQHDASMSHTHYDSLRSDLMARLAVFDQCIGMVGLDQRRQEAVLGAAHRSLAREAIRWAAVLGGSAGPAAEDAGALIALSKSLDPSDVRQWEWEWLSSAEGRPMSPIESSILRVRKWSHFKSRKWQLDFLTV